jgi:predicted 3-demethylubiquinone-9 3-methyltransferase (glyoxalase superfamily)
VQKITTFLWFNSNAEEAASFYTSVFKNSKILNVSRYGDGAPFPRGTAMTVTFQLEGQTFVALNGGPHYQFTPAISLFVDCGSQEEVDRLWTRLTDGGEESQCAWLKDRFGLSWQIVPRRMMELIQDPDPAKARRVMEAMLRMKKIVIADLEAAHRTPSS